MRALCTIRVRYAPSRCDVCGFLSVISSWHGNSEVPKSSPVVVQPSHNVYLCTSLPDNLSTEDCSLLEPQEVTMHFNVMTYPDPSGYFIQWYFLSLGFLTYMSLSVSLFVQDAFVTWNKHVVRDEVKTGWKFYIFTM